MTDTESVPGESLLSPFCRDTRYGRDLREQVIQGNPNAAGENVPAVVFLPVGTRGSKDEARACWGHRVSGGERPTLANTVESESESYVQRVGTWWLGSFLCGAQVHE
jgi:hypothetical protein